MTDEGQLSSGDVVHGVVDGGVASTEPPDDLWIGKWLASIAGGAAKMCWLREGHPSSAHSNCHRDVDRAMGARSRVRSFFWSSFLCLSCFGGGKEWLWASLIQVQASQTSVSWGGTFSGIIARGGEGARSAAKPLLDPH
jgi:hypothetical protein